MIIMQLFFSVSLLVTMDLPPVQLLCLEQKDCSQESNTRDFFELACQTNYPDRSCFTTLLQVLVNNNLPFTIDAVKGTSPTPDPEPRQPSPNQMEHQPDSITDTEPEPATDNVPAGPTEPYPALEPEPHAHSHRCE